MTQKTITRADIADAIYRELGFSHAESFKLIEQMLQDIITALSNGETVKISKFASFIPHKKKERVGRNPKTGVKHAISPRTVVSFKASNTLKNMLKNS
ncbi:MAG: HU family DNA-binding protein [Alphaproteobacteria bacterium]|nr:HU family DNA-binding protein [Alphaproteobacteria bacterium]